MAKSGSTFRQRKLLIKLVISFLIIALVPLIFAYFLNNHAAVQLQEKSYQAIEERLYSDLDAINSRLEYKKLTFEYQLAVTNFSAAIFREHSQTLLSFAAENLVTDGQFHFIRALDAEGYLFASLPGVDSMYVTQSIHPLVEIARTKGIYSDLVIEPPRWMNAFGFTDFELDTLNINPESYRHTPGELNQGLVFEVIRPVYQSTGSTIIGFIHAGVLLNNATELLDEIQSPKLFDSSGMPLVCISLDPVRVAVNSFYRDVGIIGTVLSSELGFKVLDQGHATAAIEYISEWETITAARPLRNNNGTVLGSLSLSIDRQFTLSEYIVSAQKFVETIYSYFWMNFVFAILISVIFSIWIARGITEPVKQIVVHTMAVAEGDLTRKLVVRRRDDLGLLTRSFNDMTNNLRYLVTELQNVVKHSQDYSSKMSRAVHDLATAANQQSAAINQTTATMEELAASSRQIAESSNFVAETALTTEESARNGVQAINDTLDQMNEIWRRNERNIQEILNLGQKSKEIGDVMKLINNIVDQTKLIAFNAAIESSGVGEADRRFGIVATEIRRLADNVTESTLDIRTIIQEIQEAINELVIASEEGTKKITLGLDHTRVTSDSLNDILEAAKLTAESARQISLATNQQKTASEQVVAALQEIFEGTKQFDESNKTTVEIASQLNELSEELSKIIDKFKTE